MKSSHKASYLKSETHLFTSFDVSWPGDELLAKPLPGKESKKGEVFNIISIHYICIKYLLRSFCSVKQ